MRKLVAASRKAKWAGTYRTLLGSVIQTRVTTNAADQKEETGIIKRQSATFNANLTCIYELLLTIRQTAPDVNITVRALYL